MANESKRAIIIKGCVIDGVRVTTYFTPESFEVRPVWSTDRKRALVMAYNFALFIMTHPKAKAEGWIMSEYAS